MVFENAQDRKDTWLMDEDETKITYETFEKVRALPQESQGLPQNPLTFSPQTASATATGCKPAGSKLWNGDH